MVIRKVGAIDVLEKPQAYDGKRYYGGDPAGHASTAGH